MSAPIPRPVAASDVLRRAGRGEPPHQLAVLTLDVRPAGTGSYELGVPEEEGLTPDGWYMLVVVDSKGVPSPARWVHVG